MINTKKCKQEKLKNNFLYETLDKLPQIGIVEFYIDGLTDISGLTINQPNILKKKAKPTKFYCPLYNKIYGTDNKLKKNFINFGSTTDISKNNLLAKITDETKMKNYIEKTYFKEKTLNFSPKQIKEFNENCIVFPKKEILFNNAIAILKEIIFNNKDAKIFYKTLQDHRLERQERAYYLVNYPKISNSDISFCNITNSNFLCEIAKKDTKKESPNAEKIITTLSDIKRNIFLQKYKNKEKQIKEDFFFGDAKVQLTEDENKLLTKEINRAFTRNLIKNNINKKIVELVLNILNNNSIKISRQQSNLTDFLIEHFNPFKQGENLLTILNKPPDQSVIRKYANIKILYNELKTLNKQIDRVYDTEENDGNREELTRQKESLNKELNQLLKTLGEESKNLFDKLIDIQYDNIENRLPKERKEQWQAEKLDKEYFKKEVLEYFNYFFNEQKNILNRKTIEKEIIFGLKINENNLELVQPPSFREKREEFFSHCKKSSNTHEFRNLTIKEKQIVNNCKLLCGYPNEKGVSDCSNNFACNICKPFVNCSLGTCIENQCPEPYKKKIKSVTNCTKKIKKNDSNEEGYDDDDVTDNPKTDGNDNNDLTDKYSDFFDNFAKIKRKTLKPQRYPTKIFAMSEPSGQTQVRGGKSKKYRYKLTIKKYKKQNKKTQKIKKKMTKRHIKKKYYSKMSYKKRKTIKR